MKTRFGSPRLGSDRLVKLSANMPGDALPCMNASQCGQLLCCDGLIQERRHGRYRRDSAFLYVDADVICVASICLRCQYFRRSDHSAILFNSFSLRARKLLCCIILNRLLHVISVACVPVINQKQVHPNIYPMSIATRRKVDNDFTILYLELLMVIVLLFTWERYKINVRVQIVEL